MAILKLGLSNFSHLSHFLVLFRWFRYCVLYCAYECVFLDAGGIILAAY